MKPFNLQDCIAGKKVITRDGKEYKFGAYNQEAINDRQIAGWVKDHVISHAADGTYLGDGNEHGKDLFMASEKKEGWINIYKANDLIRGGLVYVSEKAAKESRHLSELEPKGEYITTIKIEWEE